MTPHSFLKFQGHVFFIFSSALADYVQVPKECVLLNFPSQAQLFIKILAFIFQGNRQQKTDMKYYSYSSL